MHSYPDASLRIHARPMHDVSVTVFANVSTVTVAHECMHGLGESMYHSTVTTMPVMFGYVSSPIYTTVGLTRACTPSMGSICRCMYIYCGSHCQVAHRPLRSWHPSRRPLSNYMNPVSPLSAGYAISRSWDGTLGFNPWYVFLYYWYMRC